MTDEEIQIETAGESLSLDEETSVRNSYNAKMTAFRAAMADNGAEKGALLEKILELYPKLKTGSCGSVLDKRALEDYEHISYPALIHPGDICISHSYGVIVPEYEAVSGMAACTINKGEITLQTISKLVDAVYRTVPHAPRALRKYDKGEILTAGILEIYYRDKKMRLEDFVSGELPAACFEKALTLALLILGIDRLKILGVKTAFAVGVRTFCGEYQGGHAWVRMEVPKGLERSGFLEGAYALDPSDNNIYRLSDAPSSKLKYIPLPRLKDDFFYKRVYRPRPI